jgi:phosphate starvation-inducible protein PhoH
VSTESLFSRIQPQSPGQEEIVKALVDKRVEIIGLFGPTGCGKSLFSIIYGVDAVLSGKYKRFILTRPLIDVVSGKELTAAELGEMYYRMVFSYVEDVASSVIEASRISELASKGLIVFADSHYLKGRTFDDSIVFIDDAQNLPVESAIEVVTRMGRNSRLIIAGDPCFPEEYWE